MPSTYLALNIGLSGLQASQTEQDIVGNNITNANTPGYSVESVDLQTALPLSPPDSVDGSMTNGQIGTGVSVGAITRASDQYLNSQVRSANSAVGSENAQSTALQQIEGAYNEPSNSGLNETLTSFYQSFNAVAGDPSNVGDRASAIQSGVAVANAFQSVATQFSNDSTQLTAQATNDVQQINDYATQIASLNQTIRASDTAGQQPNTLLDQRDELLSELSSLTNISTQTNTDGTVNVSIGSTSLVVGTNANAVSLAALQGTNDLQSGELAGVVQAQSVVQTNQTNLNALAAAVASQVNAVQSAGAGESGTTGLNFFNVTGGSEASTITVNPTLVADPTQLAASAVPSGGGAPAAGDGSNATKLAALQNQTVASGPLAGTTTLGFYQQMITDIGSQAQAAQSAASDATASQTQLVQQQQSVSGVSTDQEMTEMLQYQNAYQAAARYVSTAAAMLNTLVTGMFASS